ncbi:hypothetical protein D3C80_608540 [compost metagenome]
MTMASLRGPSWAASARLCTVWKRNRSLGVKWMPSSRARLTTWMERMESPPSSKKLSWMPTWARLSTSRQISASCRSRSLRGAA